MPPRLIYLNTSFYVHLNFLLAHLNVRTYYVICNVCINVTFYLYTFFCF